MGFRSFSTMIKSILIMTILLVSDAGLSGISFASAEEPKKYDGMKLHGIGYREQELQ